MMQLFYAHDMGAPDLRTSVEGCFARSKRCRWVTLHPWPWRNLNRVPAEMLTRHEVWFSEVDSQALV